MGYYFNETYPFARRLFSRPFSYKVWVDEDISALAQTMRLKNALFEMGKSFVDDFGAPVLIDETLRRPGYYSPCFWHDRTVAEASQTSILTAYRETLSEAGQKGLDVLVADAMLADAAMKDPSTERQARNEAALLPAFQALWQADPFLDPRLAIAEILFENMAREPERSYHFKDLHFEGDRLKASMEKLQEPRFAQLVAQMFVYSRLAQHLGEHNPRSFDAALKVAFAMNHGGGLHAIEQLVRAYDAPPVLQGAAQNVCTRLLSHFSSGPAPVRQEPLKHGWALLKSAPKIVEDYLRISDGSWAKGVWMALDKKMRPQPQPSADVPTALRNDQ